MLKIALLGRSWWLNRKPQQRLVALLNGARSGLSYQADIATDKVVVQRRLEALLFDNSSGKG